jgi:Sap, sulfolipid-1-addressing protein
VVGALSPVATLTAIVLLDSRRPVANTFAYLAGWTLVLLVIAGVLLAVLGDHQSATGESAKAAVGLVVGILLLGVALRTLIGERHPLLPEERRREEVPKWLQHFKGVGPLKAVGVGAVVLAISPADTAAYMTACQALIGSDSSVRGLIWILLLLCINSCIVVPLAVYLALPGRAPRLLSAAERWIVVNQRKVTGGAAGFFGVVLLVDSIVTL